MWPVCQLGRSCSSLSTPEPPGLNSHSLTDIYVAPLPATTPCSFHFYKPFIKILRPNWFKLRTLCRDLWVCCLFLWWHHVERPVASTLSMALTPGNGRLPFVSFYHVTRRKYYWECYSHLKHSCFDRYNVGWVMKSLNQVSDILVNMLKKEKKKAQDALHLSSADTSQCRHAQSSPFPPGNPGGPRPSLSSAPTQVQDSTTVEHRSRLLQRKTGQWYFFGSVDYITLNRKQRRS